jgi:hypothetical protein
MKDHGLNPVFYSIDQQLKTNEIDLVKSIKVHQPKIILVFHPVGINNDLLDKNKKWIKILSEETILIEDCVHKILEPDQIRFLKSNHYLLDSLRKVVPIQGSWVYSQNKIKSISFFQYVKTLIYRVKVFYWWVLLQFYLCRVFFSKSNEVKSRINQKAEWSMLRGYDVIGNHRCGSSGIFLMKFLYKFLNLKKIKDCKIRQVEYYLKFFNKLNREELFIPKFRKKDFRELRGFPLIIQIDKADSLLEYLRKNKFLLRFELNDCLWSQKQKIIYLPLGIYLSQDDLERVVKVFEKYFNK